MRRDGRRGSGLHWHRWCRLDWRRLSWIRRAGRNGGALAAGISPCRFRLNHLADDGRARLRRCSSLAVRILSVRATAQQCTRAEGQRQHPVDSRLRQEFTPPSHHAGPHNLLSVQNYCPFKIEKARGESASADYTSDRNSYSSITAATAIFPFCASSSRRTTVPLHRTRMLSVRVISAGRVKVNSIGDPVAMGEST